jgi:hypothetical protein
VIAIRPSSLMKPKALEEEEEERIEMACKFGEFLVMIHKSSSLRLGTLQLRAVSLTQGFKNLESE